MLKLQAIFERKIAEFPLRECVIEKAVELSEAEYSRFRSSMLRDTSFIAESIDAMYMEENGAYHCLLVLGENHSDGVLVEAEGYDYARYSSYLPGARDYLTARLNELTDQLIREGTQNTSSGSWVFYFDEIQEQYGVNLKDSGSISTILCDLLAVRQEMAEIEPLEDGLDMTFYLDYCPNLEDRVLDEVESGDQTLHLKEQIRVPFENLHLVHDEVDMCPSTIVYLDSDTLTEEGKQAWGDVLNAQVRRVFHGIYGVQAECAGVPSERLTEFSRMLAGNCPCEDYDRWVREPEGSPGMELKL